MKRKSIITSVASYSLTKEEESLLSNKKPWGIILFKRNIKNMSQLKELTSRIRFLMKDPCYPIMVDQEGGRVSVSYLKKISYWESIHIMNIYTLLARF